MEDRSLTDFTGEEPTESDDEAPDAEPDEEPPQPAKQTYDWTPDGAECAACGDRVEKRWRDDEGMVCRECKAW